MAKKKPSLREKYIEEMKRRLEKGMISRDTYDYLMDKMWKEPEGSPSFLQRTAAFFRRMIGIK